MRSTALAAGLGLLVGFAIGYSFGGRGWSAEPTIEIHDQYGELARAGFRSGDLIVGIEGVQFTSGARMEIALGVAEGRGKPVNLEILRGDERLKLEYDSGSFTGISAGGDVTEIRR